MHNLCRKYFQLTTQYARKSTRRSNASYTRLPSRKMHTGLGWTVMPKFWSVRISSLVPIFDVIARRIFEVGHQESSFKYLARHRFAKQIALHFIATQQPEQA